jgi:hypothetical protein
MLRGLLVVLSVVLYSVGAYAQTGAPTVVEFRVYQAGAPSPLGPALTVPLANLSCNQAQVTTGSSLNPKQWRFNDPVNTGRDCVLADATRFDALPDGNYEGTIAYANADGSSAEVARVPFSRRRANPPAVPTGLRILQ